MLGEAHICKLSRSKAPKRRKLAVTDIRQKPVDIFNNTTQARTLALAIIFKTQVLLQKFPFLLRYTIPCTRAVFIGSCGTTITYTQAVFIGSCDTTSEIHNRNNRHKVLCNYIVALA